MSVRESPPPPENLAASSQRQLEAIANNASFALFIMDSDQHCIFMNPAAERMTGYTLAEVQGAPLHNFIHHHHPDGRPYPLEECPIDRAFPQNPREQGEVVFVHKDGHFYPVAFTASPIRHDGEVTGTVIEVEEISERKRMEAEAAERERIAAFQAEVGIALTASGSLRDALQHCAEAMVTHLDAAFSRIWALNEQEQVLELQASAGMYTHLDGPHSRVPVGQFKIGLIAQERRPHLTNQVVGDPRVSDQTWAQQEGMVAFAGYPLIVEDRLVGVMALFARHPLTDATIRAMATVANAVALGIERNRAEEERNAALARAEHERGRLAELLEQAPALISVVEGPDHVFTLANRRYREQVGNVDLIGKPVREAFPEFTGQELLDLLDQVYRTGEAYEGREIAVTFSWLEVAELQTRYFNFVYQPIRDLQGAVSGIFIHAVDVTGQVRARQQAQLLAAEIVQLNAHLQRRADELAAANRELESFTYSVSHDLRSPLRAMDGFARILMEEHAGDLKPGGVRYLQIIRDNARQMGELIDDLLALSRLGRQALSLRAVQPADIAHQVLDELRPQLEGRNVQVTIQELSPVQADPVLLRQVYSNLLGNAVKFTRGRDPAVIEIGAQHQDGRTVYFVRDNGVGFDMRYADKLFGVFQRLHRAEEYEGTGVGLAIVQRVVHRHGGQVWAEAERDRGATFYFTLGGSEAHAS